MEELLLAIQKDIIISIEAEEFIRDNAREVQLRKGETLVQPGQKVAHSYYVTSGVLRAFCMDANGKDYVLQFAAKGWWISDFMALYNQTKATLTVDTVTEATVFEFEHRFFQELFQRFPVFETFQRANLERHVVSLHQRILNQMQLSAADRYAFFLQQYPEMEQKIPNYHIASYLGITEQSLSRIRIARAKA